MDDAVGLVISRTSRIRTDILGTPGGAVCTLLSHSLQSSRVRGASLGTLYANSRRSEAEMGVARAALERVKEQFTGLASRTELIPEAGFPAAGGLDNASTASPRMQIIAYMATRDARIVSQIER